MKTIQATEILEYYDGIEIFAGRDAIGGNYLGMRVDISGDYDRYVVVGTRPDRLRQFRSGALDLRELLLETPGGEWYLTLADMSYGEPMRLELQDSPLEQSDFLPSPGFTLDDPQLDDRVLKEAHERNSVEQVTLIGKLMTANLNTGKWGLSTDRGNRYGETADDGPSLAGLTIGSRYRFICIEEIEMDVSGEKNALSLINADPL